MFCNVLVPKAIKLATNNSQQLRYAKKSFKLQTGYGLKPILSEDEYLELKETDRLAPLEYEKIRFAKVRESCSPLVDEEHESFVSYVMKGGRRDLAYKLMHDTFATIKGIQLKKLRRQQESKAEGTANANDEDETIETDPMAVFKRAWLNSQPVVITRKVKRGGATYQVPFPVEDNQSKWLAAKWLINAVKERPKPRKKLFHEVMAQELIDASLNRGKVIKKKDDIHKLADANRAYAHYRWG